MDSDLGLKGKRAFAPASAGGLGRGVADALAAEGMCVSLFDFDGENLQVHASRFKEKYGADV